MKEPRLRILVVGASGTLGRAVVKELGQRHDIVTAGRNSGEVKLDITDVTSIRRAFEKTGPFDAVTSATGEAAFLPLAEIEARSPGESAYKLGLENKLLGQVNLALVARDFLREGGSITLTSGFLSRDFIVAGSSSSMVNGALESFVRAAAIELPRGLRINIVSPGVFTESMETYGSFFRGFEPVPVARAATAVSRSVEGRQTGQVYAVD